MPKIRLQRYMADCGVAARRECEEMILAGRVKVNDRLIRELPVFVDPAKDMISVDEAVLEAETPEGQEKVYYLLNKPKGILVTNYDPSDRKTVGELMKGVNERLFPIGRLDMDSRGALIMTNDGELANRLTHPRYGVEKTYIVEVEGRLATEDVERVKRGMYLGPEPGKASGRIPNVGGARTERFHVKILGRERGRTVLEVRLTESRNREIRRVMARIGHPVRDLNRVAIGDKLTIRNLSVGAFRKLSPQEVEWLYKATSQEHHEKTRAAAQQWYEQKEMAKERKRIDQEREIAQREAALKAKLNRGRKAATPNAAGAAKKTERERPVKKGRKPFVPPSGRNAGKMLGGNSAGKRALERERLRQTPAEDLHDLPTPTAPNTPEIRHPLGDMARDDD